MMSELFDKALLVRDNADLKQRIKELEEVLSYIADDATLDFAKECVRLKQQLDTVREIVDTLPIFTLYNKLQTALNGEGNE